MTKEKRIVCDVILCCYNQVNYIEKAVRSIYMQVVDADIRVIVADDKSTDGTFEKIQAITPPNHIRIDVLESPKNLGMYRNYERAFKSSTGDYVLILEGDDYWSSPYHIRNHVEFLTNHPEVAMSANRRTEYKQDGTYSSS